MPALKSSYYHVKARPKQGLFLGFFVSLSCLEFLNGVHQRVMSAFVHRLELKLQNCTCGPNVNSITNVLDKCDREKRRPILFCVKALVPTV